MTPGLLLGILLQMGVCAPAPAFTGPGGVQLTVIVCPSIQPPSEDADEAPEPAPSPPPKAPEVPA